MILILNEPEIHDIYGVSKVAKSYRMPLEIISDFELTFEQARQDHFYVPWVALEVEPGATPLEDFDWDLYAEAVVITGSMNHGLPQNILDQIDEMVKVEQYPNAGYLSPTVAVGIFLYERFKHFVPREVRA